jgi:prepilin-type N-terminal cleavage/methylation domain-containing protein
VRILRNQSGLSLIEILVVVAVIVLVTGMGAPRMFGAITRAQSARVDRDLGALTLALEAHYLEHNYYPNKLGDLVKRGFLKKEANLKSPTSKVWYFYAVDDNRSGAKAQSFALGNPGTGPLGDHRLFRGNPLPRGRHPEIQRAWAWYVYDNFGLTLFEENDQIILPDSLTPTTLDDYRFSCRADSTDRCDLITN